jgi:hypothetical protein
VINSTQLWLAVLVPTLTSFGTLIIAVISLITNNSRLSSLEARLLRIEESLGNLRERVSKIEEILSNLRERIGKIEERLAYRLVTP